MLKQSKISTINHGQQIAQWVISLVLTTQYTYIQSMFKSRDIHILSTIQIHD